MTIGDYARLVRRRWRTFALVLLACTVLALAATRVLPKTYVAQTTSFVSIAGGTDTSGDNPNALYQNSQFALNQVQSYPPIVTSPDVLQPTIDDLGLDVTVDELATQVTATNPIDTVLLKIDVSAASPGQAQAIANSVAANLASLVESLEGTEGADPGTSPVRVTTAIPALRPGSPASPNTPVILALGVLLGLALGVLAAMLRDRVTRRGGRLRSLTEVDGCAPLGVVHHVADLDGDPARLVDADSPAVEDVRQLRTTLRFADTDEPLRQVVVTGPRAGSGSSTLAASLALSMSRSLHTVCLVAADLRPGRSSSYGDLAGRVGLSDVLAGAADIEDVLVPWGGDGLLVVPPGRSPAARDLLGSYAARELLAKLRVDFDLVVVDAPAVLEAADAIELGALTDGVLLVARHSRTAPADLEDSLDRLVATDVALVGTVLTDVPARA